MGMMATLRDWFGSPTDPAIMNRSELATFDTRDSLGATIAPWQHNTPIWPQRNPATYVTEGWAKAPVVFACVSSLADATATAPIRVIEDAGGGQMEPVDDHELTMLLNDPNPGMSQSEFVSAVVVNAALTGFCVIEKERRRNGEVMGLWPLRSDWIRPIPRSQSAPAWEYRIPGHDRPYVLEPEDVIVHTHAPDPNGGYTGTAPMAVALRELGIENASTDFLKAFFDRGALPVYGIIPKHAPRSQEEGDAIMERLVDRYGGAINSARPMLLTGIESIEKLGMNFDEMAYPQLRALAETHICTAFRVPPILIGIQAGLDKSTYSNYEQARRNYYEDVITPLWNRLDGALTRGLIPEFDTGRLQLEFDTSKVTALRDDENETWQRSTAALQAGGITVNDFRRGVGLSPLTSGDVLYVPFSATPQQATEERGRGAMGTITGGTRDEIRAVFTEEIIPEIERALRIEAPHHRALPESPYEQRDGRTYLRWNAISDLEQRRLTRAAQHNRDMIQKFSDLLEPRMVAFFLEQGERVVTSLAGSRDLEMPTSYVASRRALDDVGWDDENRRLAAIIEQWFGEAGVLMFAEIAGQLDSNIAWTTGNQYVQLLMDDLGLRIKGISETTRKQVEAVIVTGLGEGKSIPQMADDLSGMFADTYKGRATAIARTESQFAANTTAAVAYEESGIRKALLLDNPGHSEAYGASDGLSCAERNQLVVDVRQVQRHASAEHPNGTMAVAPLLPEVPA
jgi:HK97 family phage portal protein